MASPKQFELPPLPYAYNALEPHISEEIMTLHHSKHHQTYVTNLNKSLGSYAQALAQNDIRSQLSLQGLIKFNAGGHINHSLFWDNLHPASSDSSSPTATTNAVQLGKALEQRFGSIAQFQADFEAALLSIQGSGWGWLVAHASSGALSIVQTKDQDVVPDGFVPLLGVDMWEHAYYLQYQNGKAAYVKAIWNVINWQVVEKRFVELKEWWSSWKPRLEHL